MSKKNYSFKKGLLQVPFGKVDEVKQKLMEALNIKAHSSWLRRLNGNVDPKASEIEAVEKVFAEYGIKNVWGE